MRAVSETFKAMLSDRWTSRDTPIVIHDYCYNDFKELLMYLYSGKCRVNRDNIFGILDMAEYYNILSLKAMCDRYLSKAAIDVQNISQFVVVCNRYSLVALKESISKYLSSNFVTIVVTQEFLDMTKSVLQQFLICVKAVTQQEQLFEAVTFFSLYFVDI